MALQGRRRAFFPLHQKLVQRVDIGASRGDQNVGVRALTVDGASVLLQSYSYLALGIGALGDGVNLIEFEMRLSGKDLLDGVENGIHRPVSGGGCGMGPAIHHERDLGFRRAVFGAAFQGHRIQPDAVKIPQPGIVHHCEKVLVVEGFVLVEGDIRDSELIERILDDYDIDMIVHLAAMAGVRPSIENPNLYVDVNINGTMSMLEGARKNNIKNFIFASSSSVYGNNEKTPFSESDNVDFPISPYAATKKAGELICHTYSHLYSININCLRFFTVYGPRQRPDLAIHKFCKLILNEEPIPVFGDGSMRRDFTYIDDIIDGVVAAMHKCSGFEIYNLGESVPIRLDELILHIEKALGKKAIINRLPMQPGDVNTTYADISKSRQKLNYNPDTDMDKGLESFVKWLNSSPAGGF